MTTQDVDVEALRQEYEEMKKKQADRRAERDARRAGRPKVENKHYWKPEAGKNVVRIIPIPGNDRWYRKYREAWINRKPIVPPSSVDPEAPDPHRDYLNKLRQVEGEAGKKAYTDALDREVAVCFVVDRREEHKGPQKWTMKLYQFMRVEGIMWDAEAGIVWDLQEGRDLIVNYTPGDQNGAISIDPSMKVTPAGTEDQIAEWTALDLWSAYRVGEPSDPEYVQAVIDGTVKEFFAKKKAEWEAKKNEKSEPAPEAPATDAPAHTTDAVADDAVDELAALAPKYWVKDPKTGNTLDEPMTLTDAAAQFGSDVQVQDMDMNGWTVLKELQ